MPNLLRSLRNLVGKMRGRPKPPKTRPIVGLGHRGQALGSTTKPDLSAENIAKWKVSEQGEDFVFNGEPFLVHSTWIRMMQYFKEEEKLMVEFKDGGAVMVSPVSVQEAIDFFKAPSKGVNYWSTILVRGKGNKGKTKKSVVTLR